MSNRKHRRGGRTTPRRDDLSDVCVFCEFAERLHFVRTVTIPGVTTTLVDRQHADQLVASMQRDLTALQGVLEPELGHG